MSRFNTGNPLGSGSPLDLDDNAKNMDLAVNSEEPQWVDRFGRPRLPLMEQERQFVSDQERREGEFQADQSSREAVFSDFLQASGYHDLGEYAPGIEITAHNQYVTFGGQPYTLKPSIPVPYTTSGGWTGADFKLIGDDSLRQDLANPDKGAAMVARSVVAVDSIADLLALPEGQRREGLRYAVKSYHSYSVAPYSGGGDFAYSPDTPKSRHNGGTILSTTVPWSPSTDDYLRGIEETDDTGSGCWVRTLGGTSRYEVADFGWRAGVDLLHVLNAIKAASPAQGAVITLPVGILHLGGTFTIDKGISLVGAGTGQTAGAGPYTTIVKSAEIDGPAITVSYPQVSLRDFGITGEAGNGGVGLLVLNRSVILDNLSVSRMGSHGIRVGDNEVYRNCNLFKFNDLKVKDNGGLGIYLHQPIPDRPTVAECNIGIVSNCDISGNAYSGISVRAAAANLFLNNTCQYNRQHGIFIWPDGRSQGNVIMGGDYEVNGRNGEPTSSFADIKVSAGSKKTRIIAVESYNDPISAEIDEPTTLVLGLSSWSAGYAQDEYMGLHLPNLASANPRVLDWYEEGVFIPEVRGTSSAGGGTYTLQEGTFTRIGSVVNFNICVGWTAHTGVGNMIISGLPFTAADDYTPVSITAAGLSKPADTIPTAMVAGGSSKSIYLYTISTVSIAATNSPLAMDSSATVYIAGSYRVQ